MAGKHCKVYRRTFRCSDCKEELDISKMILTSEENAGRPDSPAANKARGHIEFIDRVCTNK